MLWPDDRMREQPTPDERVEFEKWDADRPEGVKTSEW
jgi:hypothetical protein